MALGDISSWSCVQSRFRSRVPELGEDGLLGSVRSEDHSEGGEWRCYSSFERRGKKCVCIVSTFDGIATISCCGLIVIARARTFASKFFRASSL